VKEQILHLDPHDDFNSARDKMGWTQTARVLLVWPTYPATVAQGAGRTLARRLDLLLLHRHAHKLGANIALVTEDAEVRDHAQELGLPVFRSIQASRHGRWRSRAPRRAPERRRPSPDILALKPPVADSLMGTLWPTLPDIPAQAKEIIRKATLGLGLSAVLLLVFFLLPSATVTLTPATQPINTTIEIVADPTLEQPDTAGFVPARIARMEVGDSGFMPTTGERNVASERATGAVVFTNLLGGPAVIPQGTGLRTTGGTPVRFITTQAVNLEGRLGATVSVEIKAVDPGPAGNVTGGQINAIDGPLGLQLSVTNPVPTEGGNAEPQAAVTADDRLRLHNQLLDQLQQTALGRIEDQLKPGEFLIPESMTVTQVIAETYDRAVGEPANVLNLALRIAVTGIVVKEDDIRFVAQTALGREVPSGSTLIPEGTTFERSPLATVDDDGRAHFTVTATGASVARLDYQAIHQMIRGQSVAAARTRLQSALPLAQPPQINVFPSWPGFLPWLDLRIRVNVRRDP